MIGFGASGRERSVSVVLLCMNAVVLQSIVAAGVLGGDHSVLETSGNKRERG